MRISLSVIAVTLLMLCSCQESIEERAQRECREFTNKNCPTPEQNYTITDSIAFYPDTHTYTTYTRFCGKLDNPEIVAKAKDDVVKSLKGGLIANAGMQPYIEAGFNFRFVAYSDKDTKTKFLDVTIKSSELKK